MTKGWRGGGRIGGREGGREGLLVELDVIIEAEAKTPDRLSREGGFNTSASPRVSRRPNTKNFTTREHGEKNRAKRRGLKGVASERIRCLTGLSEDSGNLRTVAC